MDKITQGLIDIGFDEKDAKVYFALLKLGQSGSSAVIRETGLHGQFVYNSINKLKSEGLVSVSEKNGRNRYLAASPYKILNRLKEKERIADELIESLNQLMTVRSYQEITTHIGEEDFRNINLEALENEPFGGELVVLGGAGDKFIQSMGSTLRKYDELRERKNIKARYIANESQKQEMASVSFRRKDFNVRILPGLNTGLVNTIIFSDQVLMNIYGTPLYAIRIQNKAVTESNKNFFENIWKLSRPI